MGRGKIEIKRIENRTNRQVTYSKRRNGIFKKAQELSVLCDAKLSIIIFSNTGKLHEFISPSITTKKIYDQYQKTLGIDLWSKHYERMQENLRKLKETNCDLRRQIRQMMGEDLNDLRYEELYGLEQTMASSLEVIRDRKYHVIKTQTETYRKKLRNLEERHTNLLIHYEAKYEYPQFGLMEGGDEREFELAMAMENGAPNLCNFRFHHSHHHPLQLASNGAILPHDLSLA